jgi:hypothetical protein
VRGACYYNMRFLYPISRSHGPSACNRAEHERRRRIRARLIDRGFAPRVLCDPRRESCVLLFPRSASWIVTIVSAETRDSIMLLPERAFASKATRESTNLPAIWTTRSPGRSSAAWAALLSEQTEARSLIGILQSQLTPPRYLASTLS